MWVRDADGVPADRSAGKGVDNRCSLQASLLTAAALLSLQQEFLQVQESGPLLSRAMNCRAMAPVQQACLCAGHQQGIVQHSWPIMLSV